MFLYNETEAASESGLDIAAECLHTGGRQPAKLLRRKIQGLLPAMDGSAPPSSSTPARATEPPRPLPGRISPRSTSTALAASYAASSHSRTSRSRTLPADPPRAVRAPRTHQARHQALPMQQWPQRYTSKAGVAYLVRVTDLWAMPTPS